MTRQSKALLGALVLALVVLSAGSGVTFSSWTTAAITNPTNTVGSGYLKFTHTYPTSQTCTATAAATVSCNGTLGSTAAATDHPFTDPVRPAT